MPAEALAGPESGGLELACVEAGGLVLGVDVRCVREVVRAKPVTPLPECPPLVDGVAELRGAAVPVIDLARALGRERDPETRTTRLVVVSDASGRTFALRVAAATEVLRVGGDALETAPDLAQVGGRAGLVEHLVHRPDLPPVLVLSVDALYRRAIHPGET